MNFYATSRCYEKPGFRLNFIMLNRSKLGALGVWRKIAKVKNGDVVVINGALGFADKFIDLFIGIYLTKFKVRVAVVISNTTWYPRTMPEESKAGIFPHFISAKSALHAN